MEPSTSSIIIEAFEVKNRSDERLKILVNYRKTHSLNHTEVPHVDKLIQTTSMLYFILRLQYKP